jgi:type II secretory pathway pseudopilin PulG
MNRKQILLGMVALSILAIAALAARSWLEGHDDQIAMKATLDAQRQLIAAADQREQRREQELKSSLAEIAELKRRAQTPQQIIRELPQYLPLPQPIQLVPAAPSSQKGSEAHSEQGSGLSPNPSLPDKHSTAEKPINDKLLAQFPAEDLKPLYDFVQDCRACQAQLASAQSNLADERTKSEALARERDAAIKAAKGGGFWTRVKRNAKWLAIGVGVGYAASRAH